MYNVNTKRIRIGTDNNINGNVDRSGDERKTIGCGGQKDLTFHRGGR